MSSVSIPGVNEDVSEVILNLKEVRLKMDDATPRTINVDASGEGVQSPQVPFRQ
jgi:DNA-directed RNA polymerase subunit alpha